MDEKRRSSIVQEEEKWTEEETSRRETSESYFQKLYKSSRSRTGTSRRAGWRPQGKRTALSSTSWKTTRMPRMPREEMETEVDRLTTVANELILKTAEEHLREKLCRSSTQRTLEWEWSTTSHGRECSKGGVYTEREREPRSLLRDPKRRPAYGRRGVPYLGKYRRTPVFTEKSSMYRQRPKLHASQLYSRVTK